VKTIWKTPLKVDDGFQDVKVRRGAKPIHVGMQGSIPTVWWQLSDDAPLHTEKLIVIGTGHEVPSYTEYIGSGQFGIFVWHIYRMENNPQGEEE